MFWKRLFAELNNLRKAAKISVTGLKRVRRRRFLDNDLLPQVKEALGSVDLAKRSEIEADLEKATEAATELGILPDASPKVQELRRKLQESTDGGGGRGDFLESVQLLPPVLRRSRLHFPAPL